MGKPQRVAVYRQRAEGLSRERETGCFYVALKGKTRPRRNALGRNTWIQHKALSVAVLSCKQQKPIFCIFSMYKSSDTRFAKMFSHCVGCIFIFLMVCYKAQKVLIMAKPNLSIFFVRCGFDVISKKAFSNSR